MVEEGSVYFDPTIHPDTGLGGVEVGSTRRPLVPGSVLGRTENYKLQLLPINCLRERVRVTRSLCH